MILNNEAETRLGEDVDLTGQLSQFSSVFPTNGSEIESSAEPEAV